MNKYMILNTNGYYAGTDGNIYTPEGTVVKMNKDNELAIEIDGVFVTKPPEWFKLLGLYRITVPTEFAERLHEIMLTNLVKCLPRLLNIMLVRPRLWYLNQATL